MVTGLPAISRPRRRPAHHGAAAQAPNPDQAGAPLRLPDQRGELPIGGTSRQPGEQRPEVRLANAGVNAVQDDLERPFAGKWPGPRSGPREWREVEPWHLWHRTQKS